MKEKGMPTDLRKFTAHLHNNHFVPNKVIVDCTASAEIAEHYLDWLKMGIHIVTPNKKANSGPLDKVIISLGQILHHMGSGSYILHFQA